MEHSRRGLPPGRVRSVVSTTGRGHGRVESFRQHCAQAGGDSGTRRGPRGRLDDGEDELSEHTAVDEQLQGGGGGLERQDAIDGRGDLTGVDQPGEHIEVVRVLLDTSHAEVREWMTSPIPRDRVLIYVRAGISPAQALEDYEPQHAPGEGIEAASMLAGLAGPFSYDENAEPDPLPRH